MIPRFIQTIYCDDIRQEVSGKLSYIGVYQSTLFVSKFPATLPKFCADIKVVTPFDNPLKSLTIKLLKDKEVFKELEIGSNDLESMCKQVDDLDEDSEGPRIQTIHSQIVFSPFPIDGPFDFRVRAQTESEELAGIGLAIRQGTVESEPASK